jgi:predicted ATPase
VPLVAPLLGLAVPPTLPSLLLSPEQQRKRLLATLVRWALWASGLRPAVIAIEDLHWAGGPSTLELIGLLVEQGATSKLLRVTTARPEFHPPRASRTRSCSTRAASRPSRPIIFKHGLMQDAAYQSLLRTRRRELQRAAAEALAKRSPAGAAEPAELLAPLYAAFTEGFGARDLVLAKALLDELG